MSGDVRWGIVGTGIIASVFADALSKTDGGTLTAVGSRTPEGAARFAQQWSVPHAHGSYEALVADPGVDAVYIATPHAQHLENTVLSLEAGKAVLCEKPMSLSVRQTTRMAEIARDKGLFLMEALLSRFLPAYQAIEQILRSGEIGDVLSVEGSFGYRTPVDPESRLFALELGGGALLDLGIYPVHLAHFVLGAPDRVHATAHIGETAVDEETVVTMGFPNDALAIAHVSLRTELAGTGRITGTEGAILIPAPMQCPLHLDVVSFPHRERRRVETPHGPTLFSFEIAEVHRCLAAGLTESPVLPLRDSIAMATTLDLAQAAIGLSYAG